MISPRVAYALTASMIAGMVFSVPSLTRRELIERTCHSSLITLAAYTLEPSKVGLLALVVNIERRHFDLLG